MALKNFLHKLTSSETDDDSSDSAARDEPTPDRNVNDGPAVIAIAEVVPRRLSAVVGEISAVRVVDKSGAPWLEVTVSDGTGKLVAVWTGRQEVAGVKEGKRLMLSGRAAPDGPGGRLLLYNPRYELL